MNAKTVTFIAMMSTLGNVLFLISYYLGGIAPGVALDFSLVGVFVAGLYGGPIVGFATGLLAGILPGVFFGPMSGNWIGLFGLPFGKALTGLTAGLIYKGLSLTQRQRSSVLTVPLILVSYVPEFLFTVAYFLVLFPIFVGFAGMSILLLVMPKAWAEVILMSVLMAALLGNQGFSNFVNNFFGNHKNIKHSSR